MVCRVLALHGPGTVAAASGEGAAKSRDTRFDDKEIVLCSWCEMTALFDDKAVRAHLSRAARQKDAPDFLWKHLGAALAERLLDIRRAFDTVLEIAPQDLVT